MSHLPNAVEDFWAEENSEGYVDVTLQSAVVPSDGKLYVMFHGTTVEAAESIIRDGFKRSSDGTLGKGVYVSRQFEKAKSYPQSLRGQNVVLRVRVNVGKVIRIDRKGHPLQKTWHSQYDTAWIPPMAGVGMGQLEEDCVSNPNRIKVINVDFAPSEQILRRLRGLIPYRNRRM